MLLAFEQAVERALDAVTPLPTEWLPIDGTLLGRCLSQPLTSRLAQPPADCSAMDGYAVRAEDLPGALTCIGESAAGHPFGRPIASGQTVRIFTGGLLPPGADAILIQENAQVEGSRVISREPLTAGRYVRARGLDFDERRSLPAGSLLTPRLLALAGAMDHDRLPVHRQPRVAILATGDELVAPGQARQPGQIVGSNHLALQALVLAAGGRPDVLPFAPDRLHELQERLQRFAGFDLALISGGASVGDHDLVRPALESLGAELAFWKIAMRPGKPLMMARLGDCPVLGLPGNPVSSYITALLFAVPMIRRLSGRSDPALRRDSGVLATDLPANDQRRDFLRGWRDADGRLHPADNQDSSLLGRLADANVLIDRPAFAPAAWAGERLPIWHLDPW